MNQRYLAGRRALGTATDWEKSAIAAVLVTAEYAFNERDQSFDRLSGIIGEPVDLEARAVDAQGFACASGVSFKRVRAQHPRADGTAPPPVRGIVIFERGGALIAYYDEVGDFPMFANGGDIEVAWPGDRLLRL